MIYISVFKILHRSIQYTPEYLRYKVYLLIRKRFTGNHQTFSIKTEETVETLTQQIEQFPALGEDCNIDIDDDFIGTNFKLDIFFCRNYKNLFIIY